MIKAFHVSRETEGERGSFISSVSVFRLGTCSAYWQCVSGRRLAMPGMSTCSNFERRVTSSSLILTKC